MLNIFTRNWWLIALRGLLAVIFGLLAIIWPSLTVNALVLLFGVYAVVDGIFSIVAGLGRRRSFLPVLGGLLGIVLGILAWLWPQTTAVVLLYIIAAYALLTGIFELLNAVQLRKVLENEWLLAVGGILSIVFGVLLIIWPAAGLVTMAWLIGLYALLFGILLIGLGFRLRGLRESN
jgi:uncharacterized membrane protein HdeD (DUF308 family)